MSAPHLLLLGETPESGLFAGELAQAFPGWRVTTETGLRHESAAPGGTADAFEDADSLAAWLVRHDVTAVVDASAGGGTTGVCELAAQAVRRSTLPRAVPLLRLRRPPGGAGQVTPAGQEGVDVAESVPEALLWVASVAADDKWRGGLEDEARGARSTTPQVGAAEVLRGLGWGMTGDLHAVAAALDAGEPVDIDNPAGWRLPDFAGSLSAGHPQVTARILVTDMNPGMAMQFSDGAPTLVLSPPSLVLGIDVRDAPEVTQLETAVRDVLGRNLLAAAAVVALVPAGEDGVELVEEVGRALDADVWAVSAAGDTAGADDAVTAAGADLTVPATDKHVCSVAVGRLAPRIQAGGRREHG